MVVLFSKNLETSISKFSKMMRVWSFVLEMKKAEYL